METFVFDRACHDVDTDRVVNPLAAECLRRLRAVSDALVALDLSKPDDIDVGDAIDVLDGIARLVADVG